MQAIEGPPELGGPKKMPACSLSPAETAMGGILRMCMHNLENKDRACRQKGYKRYWVVTNVDRVAADIKNNLKKLKGQSVFTRDFARMYTSIPQERLKTRVKQAIAEVFTWHGKKTGFPFEQVRVDIAYSSNGRATAKFNEDGFSLNEISNMLSEVCMAVYFQQHDQGQIRRQVRGLPMGGKCSAELANLYWYAVEAGFIDHLIENNRLDEARKWFFTWRYIDDLCGFGDRGQNWDQLRYGMDHEDTTDSPYNVQTKSSMTVFLGMKITTNADGIWTSVQPKGVGWKWIPQRFIEYGSCHTHYTKWYMLKGLLIRALTICNNQPDFMKAVIYLTQGLISRGFRASALRRVWRKFMYDKIPAQNTRKVLTEAFEEWLGKQIFSQSSADEDQQRQRTKDATQHQFESFLINGLTAINHILRVTNSRLKTLEDMKQVAISMADLEANIISGFDARHILSLQHKNIYPADILLNVLRNQDNLLVNKWDETSPIQAKILLVASGKAWTAVLHDKQ